MKDRPIPVLLVACLFILAGTVALIYHAREYLGQAAIDSQSILVLGVRIVAVACGILLLRRVNWARWVAIAWLAYHVVLSFFHSLSETIFHVALMVIVSILLFLPKSSEFFRDKRKLQPN
jgi:predicted membrane protein